MKASCLFGVVVVTGLISSYAALPQTAPKLARDVKKPFVYIEFDHTGPREPQRTDEPSRGLWLRVVNNSQFPIIVISQNASTPEGMIIEDIVAPKFGRIPKSGFVNYGPMPKGYQSAVCIKGSEKIDPGEKLLFSVPVNHVAPGWLLQVPFYFQVPPVDWGAQPICLAQFFWEDVPEKDRWLPEHSRRPRPAT